MVTIQPRPIGDYVEALTARRPFVVSRWGDGEWSCLLGRSGGTCDGQMYSAALRRALTDVLKARPAYELQLGSMALRRFAGEVEDWLRRRRLSFQWGDAGMWARASQDGTLLLLTRALADRAVILVGPTWLRQLPGHVLAPNRHIVVPDRDAFDYLEWLTTETAGAVTWSVDRAPVVAVSAGPAAKIVVHQIASRFPRATVIDFGSVWDPYAGKQTRTYHRAILTREAVAQ